MKSESLCKIIEGYIQDNYSLDEIGKIIIYKLLKMKKDYYLSHYYSMLSEKAVREIKKDFIKSLRKSLSSRDIDYLAENPYFIYQKFISKMENTIKNQSYYNNSVEGLLYQKLKSSKVNKEIFREIANIFYKGSLNYLEDSKVNSENEYLAREYNYIVEELKKSL